jgi:hypothetical protein
VSIVWKKAADDSRESTATDAMNATTGTRRTGRRPLYTAFEPSRKATAAKPITLHSFAYSLQQQPRNSLGATCKV